MHVFQRQNTERKRGAEERAERRQELKGSYCTTFKVTEKIQVHHTRVSD